MAASRKAPRRRKKQEEPKVNLKERMTEILELPKEVVLNMPKLTMLGNGDLIIENYKGIIEYENGRMRINTSSGIIRVTGSFLVIKEITSEDIIINGEISALEFMK